jgi:ribosome biogenesis SPOUT family RNA methylase Rps3
MLTLAGPSSKVHFTSLSSTSIPPLRNSLSSLSTLSSASTASGPSTLSDKAHLHTDAILPLLSSHTPPISASRVCLLDPKAPLPLAPDDKDKFDWFLYGGILGDDPPRDRTGELRKLGFEGRHLGSVQMTTDTALGVTKIVVEDGGESM